MVRKEAPRPGDDSREIEVWSESSTKDLPAKPDTSLPVVPFDFVRSAVPDGAVPDRAVELGAATSKPADGVGGTDHAEGTDPEGAPAPRTPRWLRPSTLWAKTAPAREAFGGWASRPSGRLSLAGMVIAAMLVFAGAAGAYVVPPATAPQAAAVSESSSAKPSPEQTTPGARIRTAIPFPSLTFGTRMPNPTSGVDRPADAFAAWAVPMGRKLDIPSVAMQAYAYTETVMAQRKPSCQLKWTLLAGIAKIESNHGRAKGASLLPDGRALPAIVGPPLDGQGGRGTITDTDEGRFDGDRSWDRAVGPMQFIPTTWRQYAVDADWNNFTDPNDIDDATLAAGEYLCASGRDLSTVVGWWGAVQSYNSPTGYQQSVFSAADDYGRRSRA